MLVSEFYIHIKNPDININFDLKSVVTINGVYIRDWYQTTIKEVQIGVHRDDNYTGQSLQLPPVTSSGWKWYDGKAMTINNEEQVVDIPVVAARYVQIRVKGGTNPGNYLPEQWGLRQVKISKPVYLRA
jgi:hypothetical protein